MFTNVLLEKLKTRFNVFCSPNVFYFQLAKITQITFPDSSDIGNVLTIKDLKTTAFNE